MTAKNSASTFIAKQTGLRSIFHLPQNKKKFKYMIWGKAQYPDSDLQR